MGQTLFHVFPPKPTIMLGSTTRPPTKLTDLNKLIFSHTDVNDSLVKLMYFIAPAYINPKTYNPGGVVILLSHSSNLNAQYVWHCLRWKISSMKGSFTFNATRRKTMPQNSTNIEANTTCTFHIMLFFKRC